MSLKRPLEIDDLLSVEYLSSPALSADGCHVSYVVQVADPATGKFAPRIWQAAADGSGASALFAEDDGCQKLPREAADGSLWYLSDKGNPGVFQVWHLADGSARRMSSLRHGVKWFSLSDDGTTVCFEAPLWPGETDGLEFDELCGPELEAWETARRRAPIVVEDIMYKLDETYGVFDGSILQTGVINAETGDAHLLSRGSVPHLRPVCSSDGTRVAAWCQPHDGWSRMSVELCVFDLASGAEQTLTEKSEGLAEVAPVWLDDSTLAYGCYAAVNEVLHGKLMRVTADGTGEPSDLLPEGYEQAFWGPGSMATGHTALGYSGEVIVATGADSVALLSANRGVQGVWSATAEGSYQQLTPDTCCVHAFDLAGEKIAYVKGEPSHLAELYLLDLASGQETKLAHHNVWADEVQMAEPQEVFVDSPADGKPIRGWFMRPADAPAEGALPCVLDIHGGPECHYPVDWWFEFQYLAARGMAVIWCDPHGSITFGDDWQKGAWDGTGYNDLMAFVDHACETGLADPERLGVTGGSYGGYMTNVVIGSTTRFAAAVAQRNLCNRATSYGTGDMGTIKEEEPFRGCLDSLTKRMRSRSTTIKTIDKIVTPTCVLHATNDYRCSFEQGEQLYHALRDRRPEVPSKLVAFPGENHGLTREGNAYAQRGHLLEMANWFDRFLIKGEGKATSDATPKEA